MKVKTATATAVRTDSSDFIQFIYQLHKTRADMLKNPCNATIFYL
jgi:hypothetical protein